MTPAEIREFLTTHQVEIRPVTDSRFLRCIAKARSLVGARQPDYWVTLGRTIYYPLKELSLETDADLVRYKVVLEHELVHIRQQERLGWLFYVLWALLPLPFFLAYGRWYLEREAYMVQYR